MILDRKFRLGVSGSLGLMCLLCLYAPVILADESPASRPAASSDTAKPESDHWAFQPVQRPSIPAVRDNQWVRNPIDAFVLARLERRGWTPALAATPTALTRRLYLDLIGLPPSLPEQDEALASPTPDGFDQLVDELLTRPAYGERWGRHWLDLVRYAETNGYERDGTKPYVWRYRDWVIQSLNDDKPYNRFIVEQLAGDELDDATAETMIATGYYRLGAWDDEPADFREDRFDQLDDILNATSQAFLAMTLACARCHDHKFEPLTQRDYYSLVAIFNTLSRPQSARTELDRPVGSREQLLALAARDRDIAAQAKTIDTARDRFRESFVTSGRSQLPGEALTALRTAAGKRDETQQELAKKYQKQFDEELVAAVDPETKAQIAEAESRIEQLRRDTPDLPRGYFLEETSPNPPPIHVLIRGKASNTGEEVQPALPAVIVGSQPEFLAPGPQTSRRRLTLARWLATADNPLTARVMVNRVWQQHFGAGLVRTPNDFGVMGSPPSHSELLDWLADWFVRDAGWSLKKLHRLILQSNTYRMSRESRAACAADDPENELLWRLPYQRLEVEAICDSMLTVSGRLNSKMFGPAMYPFVPAAAFDGHADRNSVWPQKFDEQEASRRTVYAFVKRSLVVPLLEVLDLCDTTKSSGRRTVTSVAPQALTMFNGDFVNRQSEHFADRLLREAGDDARGQIELAYRLALCRRPTPSESQAMQLFLDGESNKVAAEAQSEEKTFAAAEAHRRALVQLCRVVLNLNEFVYPD